MKARTLPCHRLNASQYFGTLAPDYSLRLALRFLSRLAQLACLRSSAEYHRQPENLLVLLAAETPRHRGNSPDLQALQSLRLPQLLPHNRLLFLHSLLRHFQSYLCFHPTPETDRRY
jgi:hypothetical protein